jgi:predicted Zn-dependent peptidase
MKPISQYDYFSASVAGRVLSNGLVGLVPQIIREENSAAYYAYSRLSMYKFGGVLYVAAGVSQENLTKCLKLSIDILNRVVEKDFSDDHLKMAQEKSKAMLDQYMDNPKALFELYSSLTLRGLEILSYDEWIDKIQSVTKAQVAQFVESILNGSQFYLAVNGNLEDKVMNNCKELIK